MNWDKVTGSKDRHGSERDQRPAIDMDTKTGADFCLGVKTQQKIIGANERM